MIKKISEEKVPSHGLVYYNKPSDIFGEDHCRTVSIESDLEKLEKLLEKDEVDCDVVIYHYNEVYEVTFPSERDERKKEKNIFEKLFYHFFPFSAEDDRKDTFEFLVKECKEKKYYEFRNNRGYSPFDEEKNKDEYVLYIHINRDYSGRGDSTKDTKTFIYKFPNESDFYKCRDFVEFGYKSLENPVV